MRVVDIGCGVGDLSEMAARLVGPSGTLLGIDRSPEACGHRSKSRYCSGTRLVLRRLDHTREKFDALIGRSSSCTCLIQLQRCDGCAVIFGHGASWLSRK